MEIKRTPEEIQLRIKKLVDDKNGYFGYDDYYTGFFFEPGNAEITLEEFVKWLTTEEK